MARLSLCMIARDEERFLGACLDSARGIVDEMIVVDTGSRDATRQIAERAGATVIDFAWVDDFAQARNVGLEAASGTHILVLDADEVLGPGASKALRTATRDKDLAIGMLPLYDADALDASAHDVVLKGRTQPWPPTHLARLFKNHPRLRFRRAVHETLFSDIEATLADVGGEIRNVRAPIVHYGEVAELRAQREKRERNVRILQRALELDPTDGDLAGYLANELAVQGDLKAAEEVARKHLPPFLTALEHDTRTLKPSPIRLAAVLATIQLQRGTPADALETVRRSAAVCLAPHPNLRFLEGVAFEQLGEPAQAEQAFRDCLAMHGEPQTIPVNPGATSEAPRLRLANLYVAQGLADEALEVLERGGEIEGKLQTAARLAAAEAHLTLGQPDQALMCVTPLLQADAPTTSAGEASGPSEPPGDLFALAAVAALMLGQADPALADAARTSTPEGWLEPRRRALLSMIDGAR